MSLETIFAIAGQLLTQDAFLVDQVETEKKDEKRKNRPRNLRAQCRGGKHHGPSLPS